MSSIIQNALDISYYESWASSLLTMHEFITDLNFILRPYFDPGFVSNWEFRYWIVSWCINRNLFDAVS